jgi:RNA 2',3'-cyclic 3'-phosphodiesterase
MKAKKNEESKEKMRLFLALNLPKKIRTSVYEKLSVRIPENRFSVVWKENLHITIKFFGNKNKKEAQAIKKRIEEVCKKNDFEVEVGDIGSFGSRVMWLGIKKGRKEIEKINQKFSRSPCNEKSFHAHVTLARNKKANSKEFKKIIQELAEQNFSEKFTAKKICLMQSILTENKPKYTKI